MNDRLAQTSWWRHVARWPVHRPVATLLIALVLLVLAGLSVLRLSFDPRLESLLPHDAASTDSLSHVIADFHLLDEALVLVEVPRKGGESDLQTQERDAAKLVAFAERFVNRIQSDSESVSLIESMAYKAGPDVKGFIEEIAVPFAVFYLDDDAFHSLLARLSPQAIARQMQRNDTMIAAGSPAADQLAKNILRDPLRLHDILIPGLSAMKPNLTTWRGGETYLSPDARHLLIRITAKHPATHMTFTKQLMSLLERAADDAMPDDLLIHYGGAYAIARFSEKHIRSNMVTSITGTIILMQILFLAAYGRIRSFPLVFIPIAGGVLLGFGVYSLIYAEISPITAGIGAILAGLGVDYSIHFLSHYEAARSRGATAQDALNLSGGLGASLVHACATSMIGFLAIMASTIPALRDFALLGALGLCGSLLGTMTILPALLVLLDGKRTSTNRRQVRLSLLPFVRWLGRREGVRWIGPVVVAVAVVLITAKWNASSWFASDVRLMHPQPNAPLDTQDRIAESFGLSTESMLIHLKADSSTQLLPLASAVNEKLRDASLDTFGVKATISPATYLPSPDRVERRMEQLQTVNRDQVLEAFREAVAASLFSPDAFKSYESYLQSMLHPQSAPDWQTLAKYSTLARMLLPVSTLENPSKQPTQAMAYVQLSRPMKSLTERDQLVDALRAQLDPLPGAQLTGLSIISRDIELAVRRELPRIALVAIAVVIVWVIVLYRQPSRVLIAMTPVFMTGIIVLAILRTTGTGLNMINMAAIPILVGAAIDNGIFLVSTVTHRESTHDSEALNAALADRCHAMTLCSITTVIGFGSLMFTSVPAIASLGLVLASGMAGCWFASVFVVTPMLLRSFSRMETEVHHG